MSTITMKQFDPIEYAQQLRGVGVSFEQADIQAQAFEKVINDVTHNHDLATKKDLSELKLDLIQWLLKTVLGTGVTMLIAIAGMLKYMR